jgi:hypothetical protein
MIIPFKGIQVQIITMFQVRWISINE